MKLKADLKSNEAELKKRLNSDDMTFLDLNAGKKKAVMIFINDLADKEAIGELVLRPLANFHGRVEKERLLKTFLCPEKKVIGKTEEICDEVTSGNSVLLVDGITSAISFSLKKYDKRAITEPPTSTVIKGPREGFVESLPVNISLMRRRLKTPDLTIENLSVGKYGKTPVSVLYIKGLADQTLIDSLKKKISQIEVDAVLDSSYISKFLGEHKTSVFKQIGNTEKPDILSAKILEGRVAILVDGSPIALTVPYLLIEDFQSPSDYYSSPYSATFSRLIRAFAVVISIFLPALFASAELFHLQLIPLPFLLTIVNSIKGIPLSPSYEMFFTLLIFEILNEASVRMPKYVGMVVSIVGGLVLGETAVNAGIISAPALMIIALSGICLYTVPELEQVFSILRILYLVISGTIGGYGLIVASAIVILYLVSFENYGTPLMAPFSPLIKTDLKDGITKGFNMENSEQVPLSLKIKRRCKNDQTT